MDFKRIVFSTETAQWWWYINLVSTYNLLLISLTMAPENWNMYYLLQATGEKAASTPQRTCERHHFLSRVILNMEDEWAQGSTELSVKVVVFLSHEEHLLPRPVLHFVLIIALPAHNNCDVTQQKQKKDPCFCQVLCSALTARARQTPWTCAWRVWYYRLQKLHTNKVKYRGAYTVIVTVNIQRECIQYFQANLINPLVLFGHFLPKHFVCCWNLYFIWTVRNCLVLALAMEIMDMIWIDVFLNVTKLNARCSRVWAGDFIFTSMLEKCLTGHKWIITNL